MLMAISSLQTADDLKDAVNRLKLIFSTYPLPPFLFVRMGQYIVLDVFSRLVGPVMSNSSSRSAFKYPVV